MQLCIGTCLYTPIANTAARTGESTDAMMAKDGQWNCEQEVMKSHCVADMMMTTVYYLDNGSLVELQLGLFTEGEGNDTMQKCG